ncbi:glycogen operon protein GlgX [Monoraphidium neglectum]|uniref:Glycogen operon protein GlgX n=1 Tax=Monoraphidium neglectum TaxID=145388 RepID=A0A0D2MW21_9CHLO|nr:glycogen operon protein GlgX [Monoraphidium neglectum]KIZ04667.1 glycogen operon protein GlgX [Monoraphidium neglectum]|eukprot:XP_013903686.1 glycogen operon protein GlgX [Monoraphidium neglectum]
MRVLREALVARAVAERCGGLSDEELADRLQALGNLLPTLRGRLLLLRADLLAELAGDVGAVAKKLVQLRLWFPQADLGQLLGSRPSLLSEEEFSRIPAARQQLLARYPDPGSTHGSADSPCACTAEGGSAIGGHGRGGGAEGSACSSVVDALVTRQPLLLVEDLEELLSELQSATAQAVAVPVTATTPRRTPLASPSLLPVPGGAAGPAYGAPLRGKAEPLGATYDKELDAYNFAVFSSAAQGVSLVLFTEQDLAAGRATYELPLDPLANRTGDVWHVMLPRLDPSLLYGFRVRGRNQDKSRAEDGTHDPAAVGHRCDEVEVVLDPYARAILSRRRYGALGPRELDYTDPNVLGLAQTWPQMAAYLPSPGGDGFDWQGDRPLGLPMEDLVIYEMHVRGFTQHPSSGVEAPGTYLGLVEKLDYIKRLGVNAIELLPVFEFNELEYYSPIPGQENSYRYNFWGYSTVGFFSPMSRYSFAVANGADGEALRREFKTMVREAHKRGIEVILDVVFNHTAEGNEAGPTISMRGLDNRVYYMLAPGGEYYNYSGCGNTLNCNHPVVRDFIVDCLRYWVLEYHVDGFRFDLASIMTRAHSAWHPQK